MDLISSIQLSLITLEMMVCTVLHFYSDEYLSSLSEVFGVEFQAAPSDLHCHYCEEVLHFIMSECKL